MPSRLEMLDELQKLAFTLVDRLSTPQNDLQHSLVNISVLQIRCVKAIEAISGCKVVDVSRALAIPVPNASRLVDRLVRHGWVERLQDPRDRRVRRLVLTPMAEAVIRRSEAAHLRRLEDCAASLDDERICELINGLRVLVGRV